MSGGSELLDWYVDGKHRRCLEYYECSEDDEEVKLKKMGNFRRKAARASSKITHSLKRRRRRRVDYRVPRVLNEENGDLLETNVGETGPDVCEPCSFQRSSTFSHSSACYEEIGTEATAYYSCDEARNRSEKETESNCGELCLKCESPHASGSDFPHKSSFFTGDTGGSIVQLISSFVSRLLAIIGGLWTSNQRSQTSNLPSNNASKAVFQQEPTVPCQENQAVICIQRLQRLEEACKQLNCKSSQIPIEKEQMLQESMERIMSIENDLEKTKKVIHATILKQLEIAEAIENFREHKFHGRRYLC